MAEPLNPKKRFTTEKDNLIGVVAWKVPKSENYPEGVKYSFTYVFNVRRAIAYDNFNNEGHHRHYFEKKMPYNFISLIETRKAFMKDVEELRKNYKRWLI